LTIKNNVISNNYAEGYQVNGGGLAIFDDDLSTYVECSGNIFSGNEVLALQSIGQALGGGLLLENIKSGSVLANNIISDNIAHLDGATGSVQYGGGIHLNYYMAADPDYYILISGNRITGNHALRGGAINCQNTGIRLENNFISQNEAVNLGGAIFLKGQTEGEIFSMINNTFTGNLVTGEGGQGGSIYLNNAHAVLLMNNIFWENSAPEFDEVMINFSTMEMYNCDIDTNEIDGEWTGKDYFTADPQFINEMMWDPFNYDAPCFNTGIESVLAFGTTFYAPDSCIGHNPRPLDGAIDVGACEVDMLWVGLVEPAVSSQQPSVSVYPNPSGGIIDFRFQIADFRKVSVKIYDLQGKEVAVILDESLSAGEHLVRWDSSALPAGIYFYQLSTEGAGQEVAGKIVKY
jgi:hypothetical protein